MKQNIHFWLKRAIALCSIAVHSPVQAQIVPDATLPINSSVASEGNTSIITGGTEAGSNLFHSFSEFSIPIGGAAYFNNAANIQNIISRVTGKSISNIDGLLEAKGTANLFLINPNGIIFGSNATLNIGGSFLASTANSITFADDNFFSATAQSNTPLLTVNVPLGLQFGENSREIRVQGNGQSQRTTTDLIDLSVLSGNTSTTPLPLNQSSASTTTGLRVQPNQTLALVGDYISLAGGTLKTSGGRIELGSVSDSSFVSLTPIDKGWALGYNSVPTFSDINLSGGATVDASGIGGGDIQVHGRRVVIVDGSQIETTTLGALAGGTLTVKAKESLEVIGISVDDKYSSGLLARVEPQASGVGGSINIETDNLNVRDGGIIAASTRGVGQGGNLEVIAFDSVQVSGAAANYIPAGLFTTTENEATGSGGNLIIKTDNLSIQNGGVVAAGTTSNGRSGDIEIKANNSVQLSGSYIPIRSRLTAGTVSVGDAGNLSIETEQLTVQDNANVSVASLGSGKAGELKVKARSVKLDNKGSISAITRSGNGGDIKLLLQELLLLRRQSEISTNADGSGNGGNIEIDTSILAAIEHSNIRANAVGGRGGNIRIATQGLFRSLDSRITATSEQGPQFDGVVEINTPEINPSTGLIPLPVELVDVSELIAQGCQTGDEPNASTFVVTGHGGLSPNPQEALASESPLVDLGTPIPRQENRNSTATSSNSISSEPSPIVEAQGWIIGKNGEVVLTATAPTIAPYIPWLTPVSCKKS